MFQNKKLKAAAAGLLLLFALTAAGLCIFLKPENQIALAAARTAKDSEWIAALGQSEFLNNDTISANIKWSSGSASGSLNVQFAGEETGISFCMGVLGASVEMQGVLTEDAVKLQIPMAGDAVYTHDIEGETPFFDELFGKRNARSIDAVLKNLSGFRWKKVQGSGIGVRELLGALKDISVEKAEPETFEIDGKEVSCKGYFLAFSGSAFPESVGASRESTGASPESAGAFTESTGAFPERAWVYLYRGRLAAVKFPQGEEIWEMRFLGGKNRDSKLMFVKGDEFTITAKGGGDGEAFPVSLAFENSEGTHLALKGELAEDAFCAEIRSAEIRGRDVRLDGEVSFAPGAKILELSGEPMDLEHLPNGQKQILLAVFRLFRIS